MPAYQIYIDSAFIVNAEDEEEALEFVREWTIDSEDITIEEIKKEV